ncbi:MBL fold metallo-hydrolase [Ensifer sp. CCNWLY38]
MGIAQYDPTALGRPAWNAGRKVGVKKPLKQRQIWAIRFFLDREGRMRDRALFDLAIASKLRGCDLVKIKIGISGAPAPAAAQNTAKTPVSITPLAQIRIGRFTVTALTDGYADMPFDYFPGRAPAEVEQAAAAQFTARPSGVRFLFNQYLIDDGERRILIDAGAAGSIGQTGKLPQALGALGLQLDQIDAVIVTHMHQDHMGGLIAGGKNNYCAPSRYCSGTPRSRTRFDISVWASRMRCFWLSEPKYEHGTVIRSKRMTASCG